MNALFCTTSPMLALSSCQKIVKLIKIRFGEEKENVVLKKGFISYPAADLIVEQVVKCSGYKKVGCNEGNG